MAWAPAVPDLTIGAQFPGEALAIKALEVVLAVIEGQPIEVKRQLWEWYIEDMKAWRQLWGLKT